MLNYLPYESDEMVFLDYTNNMLKSLELDYFEYAENMVDSIDDVAMNFLPAEHEDVWKNAVAIEGYINEGIETDILHDGTITGLIQSSYYLYHMDILNYFTETVRKNIIIRHINNYIKYKGVKLHEDVLQKYIERKNYLAFDYDKFYMLEFEAEALVKLFEK